MFFITTSLTSPPPLARGAQKHGACRSVQQQFQEHTPEWNMICRAAHLDFRIISNILGAKTVPDHGRPGRSAVVGGMPLPSPVLKRAALALALAVCAGSASECLASEATSSPIWGISVEDGKAFFYTNGSRSAVPACSTIPKRWVFDAASAKGQAMLSALMTFYALGRPVAVVGTGTCPDWGDTETVRYIIRQEEIG
jgi:hypothetical protein